MEGTYITDIKHFLDENGEIADMSPEGKNLAGFLVLLIDIISKEYPMEYIETGVRCRMKGCDSIILGRAEEDSDEIIWHCPKCGHNGIIRNWYDTKWDRSLDKEPEDG
ncbi:MAG: hypothetical protein HQL30_12425 [Candidatus Omnitrophica bacterium]|nr:hypothetical protein [Candidatus Omnitrophota bacterium]